MVSLGCLAKVGQEQCDNVGLGGPGTGTPGGMDGLSPALHPAVQALCSQSLRSKATERATWSGQGQKAAEVSIVLDVSCRSRDMKDQGNRSLLPLGS